VVGGSLNALGVVRSLSRGHMPIYLLETTRQCAAGWSRHCEFVAIPAIDGRGLIDSLVRLAGSLPCRPVLILTSDQSVNSVSVWRDEIEPLYRINLPSHETVRVLADKTLFQEFAERHGFAVPRSVCISEVAGLELLDRLRPPLIIKPADKTLVMRGLVDRAVRARTTAEARQAVVRLLAGAPRIIVQEWIDGADTELYFSLFSCDCDGNLIGLFPGRKLRCCPPDVGTTMLCVAAPEAAAELLEPTLRFIAQVGYRGLGSLEFKREPRSGRMVIIEPTVGRTDWQEEIATLCGMNLPLRTYLHAVRGHAPRNGPTYPPVAWCASAGFRDTGTAQLRIVDGFFRWGDPLPALYYYGYERGLLRVLRRVSAAALYPKPVGAKG